MPNFGRRVFFRRHVLSLSAWALASCRKTGWLDPEAEPEERPESVGTFGLPQPATTQLNLNTPLKDAANQDYKQSLSQFGGRLSEPPATLQPYYDVVVVGSGYGAAISAARLAPRLLTGKSLCVIERGREWIAGEFPDTFESYMSQVTASNPLGLYDFRIGHGIDVIQGSGLGGTSLVNANTAAIPEPAVLATPNWPASLRNLATLLPYYQRAATVLGASPSIPTGKWRMMEFLAQNYPSADKSFMPANITVTTNTSGANVPVANPFGIMQRSCTACGDCLTGCNVGAKNTLVYNYLPLAKKSGAKIFSEISIIDIQQSPEGFLLTYTPTANTKKTFWNVLLGRSTSIPTGQLKAQVVILGAGSLGTTGILLRSKGKLPTSPLVGERFSSNGDVFAVYKSIPEQPNGITPNIGGKGAYDINPGPGPTIQTITRLNSTAPIPQRMTVEDLAIPRAFVNAFEIATVNSATRSMFILGMGHDGADGRIILDRYSQPIVSWPGLTGKPIYSAFLQAFQNIKSIFAARTPFWDGLRMRTRQETAHPLGGCVMADSPMQGVINDRNQVYRPDGSVYPNLYVIDGSAIPSSLGINPFLTICAIAERATETILNEKHHPGIFS